MDNRPIGFFDSGLGGLTVLPLFRELLPGERIVYFGDTARTPYGSKSLSTVRKYSRQMLDFMLDRQVKLLAIACNTVTSAILPLVREEYPQIQIVGIIEPTVKRLPRLLDTETRSDEDPKAWLKQSVIAGNQALAEPCRLGIIATELTIKSGIYQETIQQVMPDLPIFARACPLFVPLIEAGQAGTVVMEEVIDQELTEFVEQNRLTHLLLACTHFPLLIESLRKLYPQLSLINPSAVMAEELERLVMADGLSSPGRDGHDLFFASDLSENFMQMSRSIIGLDQLDFRQISLS